MRGGNSKGFGFVEFAKLEGAQAALAVNELEFKARKLIVNLAATRK
jgi:RNA recognition motif-containing protein